MAVVREGHLDMFLVYRQRVVESGRGVVGRTLLSVCSLLSALRSLPGGCSSVEDFPGTSQFNTDCGKEEM